VILLVVLGFGLLWLLRSVALVLLASLVLAIGLQPSIRWLERRGMGRGWALAAILLAGLIVLIGLGMILVPFLIDQITALVEELPAFVERVRQTQVIGNRSTSNHWRLDPGDRQGRLLPLSAWSRLWEAPSSAW
jgi:predicted PurR-regulated permease PerM